MKQLTNSYTMKRLKWQNIRWINAQILVHYTYNYITLLSLWGKTMLIDKCWCGRGMLHLWSSCELVTYVNLKRVYNFLSHSRSDIQHDLIIFIYSLGGSGKMKWWGLQDWNPSSLKKQCCNFIANNILSHRFYRFWRNEWTSHILWCNLRKWMKSFGNLPL